MTESGRGRLAITLAVVGALLLSCGFAGYRYLDARNWFAPKVDFRALDARVRADLPPGSTEAQVVAWLRAQGFPDDRIRLTRYRGPQGSLVDIRGWIPQPRFYWSPTTITVTCYFSGGRTTECRAAPSGDFQPLPAGGSLEDVPPSPLP